MLSIQAKMLNLIFQKMPAEDVNVEHNYPKERAKNAAGKVPKCPTGITLQETLFDGISGEIIIPVNARQDKIIWFIHGGGCTTGSAKESRECTYYLAKTFGYTIISVSYTHLLESTFQYDRNADRLSHQRESRMDGRCGRVWRDSSLQSGNDGIF